MDIKTKIFWWVMGLLMVGSFGATFYRYMIKKDYIVQAQVDCDPYSEACFVWNCDSDSEVEGEACVGNPEIDTWYYKIINKNASQILSCDENDENCDALVCAQNEPHCEFVFCNEENKEENGSDICINPEEYTLANPVEEEESEEAVCEEGDEECLNDDPEEATEEEIIDETEAEPIVQTTEDAILSKDGELDEENKDATGALPIAQ